MSAPVHALLRRLATEDYGKDPERWRAWSAGLAAK